MPLFTTYPVSCFMSPYTGWLLSFCALSANPLCVWSMFVTSLIRYLVRFFTSFFTSCFPSSFLCFSFLFLGMFMPPFFC